MASDMPTKFERWFEALDKLGQRDGLFDLPGTCCLCPSSQLRRPYAGKDGFFFLAYQDGMSPSQALAEAIVECD